MLFVLPREFRLLRVRFRGSRRFCEEQREEEEKDEERERRSASMSSSRIAHGGMRAFARFFRVCVCVRTEERACFFEEIYTKQNRFYYTKATSQQPAGANRRRRNSLKSQRDGFKIKQRGADDFTLPHLSGFYFLSFFFFRNEHDWIDIRRF